MAYLAATIYSDDGSDFDDYEYEYDSDYYDDYYDDEDEEDYPEEESGILD